MKTLFRIPPFTLRPSARGLLLLVLVGVLSGCQSINRLREAQDAFNTAAALENKSALAPLFGKPELAEGLLQRPSEEALAELNNARSGYVAALLSLKQLSGKEKAQLQSDKLWGTALALRALTEWRLGKHDDALNTADEAMRVADQLYPRDAAILAALPGLIKIDLAYEKIAGLAPNDTNRNAAVLGEVQAWLVGPTGTGKTSAVDDLHAARQKAGRGHPVNLYLIQSQLAAFRNYQVAYKRAHGRNPGADDPAKKEAQYNLFELQNLLNDLEAGAAGTNVVSGWKNSYNIIPTQRPAP